MVKKRGFARAKEWVKLSARASANQTEEMSEMGKGKYYFYFVNYFYRQ